MAGAIALGGAPAQTTAPQRKVIAATGGAAVGSAVAVILTWVLGGVLAKLGLPFPDNIQSAFNTVFTTLSAFTFGYYTSPAMGEAVALDAAGNPVAAVR